MDKGKNFLHNHPKIEMNCGVGDDHVVIDRDTWEYIREELSKTRREDKMKLTQTEYRQVLEELHERATDLWLANKKKHFIHIQEQLPKSQVENILSKVSDDEITVSYNLHFIPNDVIQILSRIRR